MKAALGEPIGVSDDEWAPIGPCCPRNEDVPVDPRRQSALFRRHGVDGADRREVAAFAGRIWQVNSVFRRYRRWVVTGVFEAILETLAAVVERNASADMIDSTVVRAHNRAVRLKRDEEF